MQRRPKLRFDCECYPNYFMVAFKKPGGESHMTIYQCDELGVKFNRQACIDILKAYTVVGFNSNNYDIPLLCYVLAAPRTNAEIKRVSNAIIEGENGKPLPPWKVGRMFDFAIPEWIDTYDLQEPAPGVMIGLKQYGGRMHMPRLQDLPYEHMRILTATEMREVDGYCGNDLDTTGALDDRLAAQIALRESMSEQYGIDLRSKSDAQIAEAVIKAEIERLRGGEKIERPNIPPGTSYLYRVPAWLEYQTPALRAMLDEVRVTAFTVAANGSIQMPKSLEGRVIALGGSQYRMGIGGLHSSEKRQAVHTTAEYLIVDRDVASYYPFLILTQRLAPPHLGDDFLKVYQGIVDRRIAAKKAGDKVTADSLKITINGSFGKLGSKWSTLYAPDLMVQVTLSGQLYLLLLIEWLELAGISVVSANTDGIVSRVPVALEPAFQAVIKRWEALTKLETEETRYRSLYSRDVNNYLAIKPDGKTKGKGVMQIDEAVALQKSPAGIIIQEAAARFLTEGWPIGDTIRECTDPRKFLFLKRATGGGAWRGQPLGKFARWYRSTASTDPITYAGSVTKGGGEKKVGGSDNAVPMMTLTRTVPVDVDYAWYVREATDLITELGYDWRTGK